MSLADDASGLGPRKQVRLRLRPGLCLSPQPSGHRNGYVVKDPVTLRYFHLDENQRYLVQLMDGRHTLADIQARYEQAHRPERLTLEELETFAAQLLESGLLQSESSRAGHMLYRHAVRQERQTLWLTLLNVFCFRLPLWTPDRFLSGLTSFGKLFFGRRVLVLSLAFFALAVTAVSMRRRELLLDMPSFPDFFSWKNLLLFWCLLGLVKVLHELGHGLCCRTMGGNVQSMGVLFLVFFPTLYCNVSDSWTLPSKWKRIAISAAGIYVELWMASLAALTWCLTDAGTLIHHVCLGLVLVCGVNTLLCNGNPLMRFDGYYILADWLETPNLAMQATRSLRTCVLRCLGFSVPWDEPQGTVGRNFLVGFGLASLAYRWFLLAVTLYLIQSFFQAHRLGSLGLMLIGLGMGGMVGSQIYGLVRGRKRLRRFPEMKRARFCLTCGLATVLGLAFFLLRLPMHVGGIALVQVEPESSLRVTVVEPGFLRELLVADGQHVKAGEVLATLSNPQLEIKLKINEADQVLRSQEQKAFVALLADAELPDGREGESWTQNQFELKALVQAHRTLQKQLERLELRAPRDGVVQGLGSKEDKGKWLEKGTELCKVSNDRALRALVLVQAADQKLIHPNSVAKIHVHGGGSQQYSGIVADIAQVSAKNIPPQLSGRGGGNVPTEQDPVTKAENPHAQHFLVAVRLQKSDARLHPGVLGSVKIEAEPQTLWWRCRRFLGSTFSWGL